MKSGYTGSVVSLIVIELLALKLPLPPSAPVVDEGAGDCYIICSKSSSSPPFSPIALSCRSMNCSGG